MGTADLDRIRMRQKYKCIYVFCLLLLDLLRNKVVWITGSSSGLGEYLAYELARNGCKLILSGTSQERLENVKQKCKGKAFAIIPIYTLKVEN